MSHEWFHLDEVLVLFTAYFSPKTPSILSTASISNVRPPGICSCQAERGAAWDWPWPAHQGDTVTSQQAMLGVQGWQHYQKQGKKPGSGFEILREKNIEFSWKYGFLYSTAASDLILFNVFSSCQYSCRDQHILITKKTKCIRFTSIFLHTSYHSQVLCHMFSYIDIYIFYYLTLSWVSTCPLQENFIITTLASSFLFWFLTPLSVCWCLWPYQSGR